MKPAPPLGGRTLNGSAIAQWRSCREEGGTLPATLWALAVGAVVMAPFLGQLSTSLLAGRESQEELR